MVQHLTALLFNQPGEVDANIDAYLPAQRESNTGIKVGLFDLSELKRALMDMDNNDKAAGLDGYSIEIKKYAAGLGYLHTELTAFNEIWQDGEMPGMLRDVIITVLYKGKGPRDD